MPDLRVLPCAKPLRRYSLENARATFVSGAYYCVGQTIRAAIEGHKSSVADAEKQITEI